MDGFIFVNYAYEDREAGEAFASRLAGTGLKVLRGKISEERLSRASLIVHLPSEAARSSKSYRHMKSLAARHELNSIQFKLGEESGEEADLLLMTALELFKSVYRGKEEVFLTQEADDLKAGIPAKSSAQEYPEQEKDAFLPANESGPAQPAEKEDTAEEEEMAVQIRAEEAGREEEAAQEKAEEQGEKPTGEDPRENLFREGMELLGGEEGASVSSAIGLILRAANQGYAPAQYQLSVCYDEGLGVPKSQQEAVVMDPGS